MTDLSWVDKYIVEPPKDKKELSWVDKYIPEITTPEEEAKKEQPFLFTQLDTLKDLANKLISKTKKAAPILIPSISEERKKAPPVATIGPMKPAEKEFYEKAGHIYEAATMPPAKWEDVEYGKFAKHLEPVSQFLVQFVRGATWNLPDFLKMIGAGELMPIPEAKGEVSKITGALGHLAGLAGGGAGKLLGGTIALAPFKVTGKLATKIWEKPAKTLVGKVIQNVLKNANTLGLALGAVEWQGENAKEVLKNKLDAFLSGEAIGGFFGGMQFLDFSKAHPILNKIIRFGVGSALLDIAEGKHPLDERTLFQKAFDYGLNYYFLREGVSPKEFNRFFNLLQRDIRKFNRQAKEDGFNIKLPEETERLLDTLKNPEKYINRTLLPAPKFEATEKGTVWERGKVPEEAKPLIEYREAEIRPEEKARTVINIKPKEDGSIDVVIEKPKPEIKEIPLPQTAYSEHFIPIDKNKYKLKWPGSTKADIAFEQYLMSLAEEGYMMVLREDGTLEVKGKAPEKEGFLYKAWAEPHEQVYTPGGNWTREQMREIAKMDYVPPDLWKAPKVKEKEEKKEIKKEEEIPFEIPPAEEFPGEELWSDEKIRLEETGEIEKEIERPEIKEIKEKESLYRLPQEAYELAEKLSKGKLTGKELTEKQKESLRKTGVKIEELPPAEELKPEKIPQEKKEETRKIEEGEKIRLVSIEIVTPTGVKEKIGDIPIERLERVKRYAKKLGLEKQLIIGKERLSEWKDYLPPAEIEKYAYEILRDVKNVPEEKWREWQGEEAEKLKKYYAGVEPPSFVKVSLAKIISKLQVEPIFKAIGAADTGLALKRFHSIKEGEVERGFKEVKRLEKLGLSEKEYQQLTFLASRPGKFAPLSPEQRSRFKNPYRIVRSFFDEYAKKLKEAGIIEEEWPLSYIRRLQEEKIHVQELLKKAKSESRRTKLKNELRQIEETIAFLKKVKYVHIPRTILEYFTETNKDAPQIISQFFRQRRTADFEALADFLIEKGVIKPEDLDIRSIMIQYAHKAGHKLALAEIFNNAKKEGLIKPKDEAPETWQTLPSHLFPTLKGMAVHPVLKDYFEKNFLRLGFSAPKLGKVLSTIKLLQFYNPLFLPSYDIVQAFWAGSVRSLKTPTVIKRAIKSMLKADKHYWNMYWWGGFSQPFSPTFNEITKRIDRVIKREPILKKTFRVVSIYPWSWNTAWTLDHAIRMITYHYYIEKGFTPKEAAQLTAKVHGDYASIPPRIRKHLNRIFFTPSFRIAMMTAQAEMFSSFIKYLRSGKKLPKTERAKAKMFLGLASGIALRELFMHALGFKTDQFGLKYYKTIETEDGEKKELVIHIATPDNVFLRYFHRYKVLLPFVESERKKLDELTNRVKWELHPLWQYGMELLANKTVNFEPIYNPFDSPLKISRDIALYGLNRLIRITELLPGEKGLSRKEAYKALRKDLGLFGEIFFRSASLPYTRSPKEKRLAWKINQIKILFDQFMKEDPPETDEEAEKRIENFARRIEKLREELRKELDIDEE
ncbi:MAG: hypothetical protein J7L26_12585 [Candidatus Aminicenantes bacterium]|nr:hypothetical protein [Candidatus Aminicenantes bacterium]